MIAITKWGVTRGNTSGTAVRKSITLSLTAIDLPGEPGAKLHVTYILAEGKASKSGGTTYNDNFISLKFSNDPIWNDFS